MSPQNRHPEGKQFAYLNSTLSRKILKIIFTKITEFISSPSSVAYEHKE